MSIDAALLRRLLDFSDPVGVLTVTTGFAPEQASALSTTAPIALRNELKSLAQELESDGRDGLARHLDKRLGELGPDLDGLLDPRQSGRGRALFVGLESGKVEHVNVQVPFDERVVLRDRAFLRPLVAAIDEGRPAGIAVASRDEIRLLEWTLGATTELATIAFELTDAQLADSHGGPVAANPQRGQTSTSHREAFEDRIDDNRHRFLKQVAETLATLARDRRWDRLVLAGSDRVRDELASLLPRGIAEDVLKIDDGSWEDATPASIGQRAWPLLRSVHLARERSLVDAIVDRALGGGAGAIGARQVCAAANTGRIAHLVFSHDAALSGYVASDGTLYAAVGGTAALSGVPMEREPYLVERLVERVLVMGGQVTRLDDVVAVSEVSSYDGLAALLRW